MLTFTVALAFFFALELIYFKIADRFNIIDKPNHRSSHSTITLRGGGIIFPIAVIVGIILYQPYLIQLVFAIFLISLISFLDDIITLDNKVRFGVHLISVTLILSQFLSNDSLSSENSLIEWTLVFFAGIIMIIGVINAYNFMDGINGMTAVYSLVTISSIWFIQSLNNFLLLRYEIYIVVIASLAVFSFFNFRKKAKTFAGDVGSISIALVISYLIVNLILQTNNIKWILLLGVYGLDTVATIIFRLIRKENIFQAHRSHFYQYLANESKLSHLAIALYYGLGQIFLNISLFFNNDLITYLLFVIMMIAYSALRLKWEGKYRLLKSYQPN